MEVRDYRKSIGVTPSFKRVDTCAAEFQADTPYMYSTYDGNDECDPTTERKVGVALLRGDRPSPLYLCLASCIRPVHRTGQSP